MIALKITAQCHFLICKKRIEDASLYHHNEQDLSMNRLNLTLLLSTGLLTTAFLTSDDSLSPIDDNAVNTPNDSIERESIGRQESSTVFDDTAANTASQDPNSSTYDPESGMTLYRDDQRVVASF